MSFRIFGIAFYWRAINPGETRFYPPAGAIYSNRDGWRRPVISHRIRGFYGITTAGGLSLGLTLYSDRRDFYEAEHKRQAP